MIGYIYKITNPIGQVYIGQTIRIITRKKSYESDQCKEQKKIFQSICDYGWSAHNFKIIYRGQCTHDILDEYEIKFIEIFNSFYYTNNKYGLNMTKGGKSGRGRIASLETKQKMSVSRKGIKKIISERGKENIRVGIKKRTELYPDLYKIKSEDHKKNIGIGNKGKKKIMTVEWRKHIGESLTKQYKTGKRISKKGCVRTLESNRKTSETLKSKYEQGLIKTKSTAVVQLSKNGEFIREWQSIKDAQNSVGKGAISYCCKGRAHYKTIKGYKWMYASEYFANTRNTNSFR